jgi:hypothetical protein
MNIVALVRDSLRRTGPSIRLVGLLYLLNLLFALPLALAFRDFMTRALGDSLAGNQLMAGFDFTVVRDVLAKDGIGWFSLTRMLAWSIPVYLLASIFLTGGALSFLVHPQTRFSLAFFFQECGAYFLRFLRIFLIFSTSLLLLTLTLGLLLLVLLGIVTIGSSSEVTATTVCVLCATIFLFPALLLFLAADYARIFVVTSAERKMRSAYWEGLRFVRKEFFPVLGLQALLLLFPAIFTAGYLLLEGAIPMASGFAIILVLLFQQAYMISRMWMRVLFFTAQSTLYITRAVP